MRGAAQATAKLSAFVMFILVGARIFSLTFYGVNGHKWVEHLLVSLPGGAIGFLVFVNVLVFVLAFFLDFFELAFIIIPLLAPAGRSSASASSGSASSSPSTCRRVSCTHPLASRCSIFARWRHERIISTRSRDAPCRPSPPVRSTGARFPTC